MQTCLRRKRSLSRGKSIMGTRDKTICAVKNRAKSTAERLSIHPASAHVIELSPVLYSASNEAASQDWVVEEVGLEPSQRDVTAIIVWEANGLDFACEESNVVW
jgi:hypothetical protein